MELFTLIAPIDNRAAHQGRIRTRPHVEGDFASHVFIRLVASRQLTNLVHTVIESTQQHVPGMHSLLSTKTDDPKEHLHISLSRPIYLRAHQRDDLRRAVKNIASDTLR